MVSAVFGHPRGLHYGDYYEPAAEQPNEQRLGTRAQFGDVPGEAAYLSGVSSGSLLKWCGREDVNR